MTKPKGSKCVQILVYGTALGLFYPLILLGSYIGFETVPLPVAWWYWGIIKLILAYGVVCLYQINHMFKYALVAILLFVSGIFSFYPPHPALVVGVEALAVTGFSLTLFDIGRMRPETNLQLAGGLIFLGVILSMLPAGALEFAGVAALLFGFVLAATRLMRL